MHGPLILSFRPSETISYPFTCYEHVIAKAMGVMPMVWVDYWLPADSGDPGHLTNTKLILPNHSQLILARVS